MAARLVIVQRLLARRSVALPSTPLPMGLGTGHLPPRAAQPQPLEMILKTAFLLSSPLSTLLQQPAFTAPQPPYRRPDPVTQIQNGPDKQDPGTLHSMKAQFGIGDEGLMHGKTGSASAGPRWAGPNVSRNERFGEAPVPDVWDKLSTVKLNIGVKAADADCELQVADVAYTSIDKADLPASDFSAGFVQSAPLCLSPASRWDSKHCR